MGHLIRAMIVALILGGAVPAAPAAATPAEPGGLVLPRQAPVREGVTPVSAGSTFTPRSGSGSGLISLQRNDPDAAEPHRPPGTQGEGGGYSCDTVIDWDFGGIGEDDHLEETVDVFYYGDVLCNFYLYSIEGIAGAWDRSGSFNGEDFDGDVLSVGDYVYREWDYSAYSVGGFGVRARSYNGARRVEPGVEWFLEAPEGFVWQACNPLPGLRYHLCEGLGTSYLHVLIGAFGHGTGLTRACRDQRAAVDIEQARATRLSGGVPVSTQMVRLVPAVRDRLTAFKRDLCGLSSGGSAGPFAAQRGAELWETAVAQAKSNVAGGDDRPLYWARLAMTAALEQWRPSFGVDRAALQTALDRAARGMTSHTFGPGSGKKVFVSGFDPFGLDEAIVRGNPSGASVLKLDGATVGGAQVQSVIFPVRFAEFNTGLVEEVFGPHLAPGTQQASLITTVSQGGDQFDLEFYNGRRRSTTYPDNRNAQGGGSLGNPVVPPSMAAGEEFTATTLPVDFMRAGSAYPVEINTSVVEQAPAGSPNRTRDDGPTVFSRAVEGGGGGYLSNEIAYRVTRLRDELGVAVPSGHVHTPAVDPPGGPANAIAAQYRAILEAAIAAPPTPPIQVTADRSAYRVGDSPVYSVIGPPNTVIKWTGVRNGAPTSEVDSVPGNATDGTGRWTGSYHRWENGQEGQWLKYVRVGGRLAKVSLSVQSGQPPSGYVTADFDGDRRSDVSVWRPADGTWYVDGVGQLTFGMAGDQPVDGDFDADGRTDRAVFRPSTGTWYLQQSRDGFVALPYGLPGDLVTPGDYNGDGRTDIAVWRPSDGTWYLHGAGQLAFGQDGDRPVPADYDGDGVTDVAVFRAGTWIVRRSSDGQVAYTAFGFADDRPVPADFDGDRRADIAVYRKSEGTWYVLQSGSGAVRTEQWGLSRDTPAPGDFDRDGRADLVVWRPSEGVWYQKLSTGGLNYVHLGLPGDVPVPGVNLSH